MRLWDQGGHCSLGCGPLVSEAETCTPGPSKAPRVILPARCWSVANLLSDCFLTFAGCSAGIIFFIFLLFSFQVSYPTGGPGRRLGDKKGKVGVFLSFCFLWCLWQNLIHHGSSSHQTTPLSIIVVPTGQPWLWTLVTPFSVFPSSLWPWGRCGSLLLRMPGLAFHHWVATYLFDHLCELFFLLDFLWLILMVIIHFMYPGIPGGDEKACDPASRGSLQSSVSCGSEYYVHQ